VKHGPIGARRKCKEICPFDLPEENVAQDYQTVPAMSGTCHLNHDFFLSLFLIGRCPLESSSLGTRTWWCSGCRDSFRVGSTRLHAALAVVHVRIHVSQTMVIAGRAASTPTAYTPQKGTLWLGGKRAWSINDLSSAERTTAVTSCATRFSVPRTMMIANRR